MKERFRQMMEIQNTNTFESFTYAQVNSADGTTEEVTIDGGERVNISEAGYQLDATNTKNSNKIEVKSDTNYVTAMAVKDGAIVMGGGHHVIAEANRNGATGSASGENAKMAIRTKYGTASFESNCHNAHCSFKVTERKSHSDDIKDRAPEIGPDHDTPPDETSIPQTADSSTKLNEVGANTQECPIIRWWNFAQTKWKAYWSGPPSDANTQTVKAKTEVDDEMEKSKKQRQNSL